MAMRFEQPVSWAMIVMDGNRVVAKARKKGIGMWLLSLEAGCWTDPRARQPLRKDWPEEIASMWPKYPNLLAVKTAKEAKRIMQELAQTGGLR